ncbi:Lrp/AsnC family transcriptional regulator [Synergistaceae bacterium OttesenSCG-928-D05]|nr:Lrp/AsnC family transcriptional regulator [Synergistaceae bacterium OttesenSCG-928-D05]
MKKITLDDTDLKILEELENNARASFKEIGDRVTLSPPAVRERIRRMEEEGLITGYKTIVSQAALGNVIRAIILLHLSSNSKLRDRPDGVTNDLFRDIPGITRSWIVTGEVEGIVDVSLPTMKELESLLTRLNKMGFLTNTYMVLDDSEDPDPE